MGSCGCGAVGGPRDVGLNGGQPSGPSPLLPSASASRSAHAALASRLRRMAASDHPYMYGAHSLAARFASADPLAQDEGAADDAAE